MVAYSCMECSVTSFFHLLRKLDDCIFSVWIDTLRRYLFCFYFIILLLRSESHTSHLFKVCHSLVFSVFRVTEPSAQSILEHFHHLRKKLLYLFLPSTLSPNNLFYISEFAYLGKKKKKSLYIFLHK